MVLFYVVAIIYNLSLNPTFISFFILILTKVAGVLFIFLWLIVSQLATKLSYRRRLDKVTKMMITIRTMMRTMTMRTMMRTMMMTAMMTMMFPVFKRYFLAWCNLL